MPDDVRVWWRDEPLASHEKALMDAVFVAHNQSAYRDNPSSVAVGTAAQFNDDFTKSIVAGLMTLGGKHAPIEQTCYFLLLEDPAHEVSRILKRGGKVPGWGGTFQKDAADPIWQPVDMLLNDFYPQMAHKLAMVTDELHSHGKTVYPNPSAFTAAASIVLKLSPKLAAYFFIMGRLTAWAQIVAYNMQEKKEE